MLQTDKGNVFTTSHLVLLDKADVNSLEIRHAGHGVIQVARSLGIRHQFLLTFYRGAWESLVEQVEEVWKGIPHEEAEP